jgi:hypothetical protein
LVGAAFALGASEDAHAVSGEAYFTSGSFCVGERASTYQSPYSGVLYGESVTRSLGNYYGPCTAAITKPAGYLSGRVFVYKWDERYRDWFLCRRSGWLYNSGSTYALSVYAPLGYPYNRWCGSGWYGTEAQGPSGTTALGGPPSGSGPGLTITIKATLQISNPYTSCAVGKSRRLNVDLK